MALPYIGPGDPANIKGSGLPTEQADSYVFIKGQGWTTVKIFEGPTKDGVGGKAQEMVLAGFTNVRFSQSAPGVWRAEGSIEGLGDGSEPTDNDSWSLQSIVEGRAIELHPLFYEVASADLREIEESLRGESSSQTWEDPAADTLYLLKLRNIDTYEFDVPVLVHTVTPAYEPDITGVRKIWTAAQIGVNNSLVGNTVDALYANPPTATPTGYTWGWLQMFPDLTADVYGRSALEERWMLNFWHSDLFDTL